MPDPMTRLQALERAVAGLLAGGASKPRRSEALQPTYVTADAAGRTGANFTGHVHAQGLDLDAGAGTVNQVRWTRTTDGAFVMELGANVAAQTGIGTWISGDPDDVSKLVQLREFASVANRLLDITIDATVIATLLDDANRSSFLRAAAAGGVALSMTGTTVLTWPGGSQSTGTVNVHLTGATGHVDAIATPQGLDGALLIPSVMAVPDGAGGINLTAETKDGHAPVLGTTVSIAWVMWGA